MSSKIIIDNWSLQHVAQLLGDGASSEIASVIRVAGDKHRYDDISEAIVQTEALFELLSQIVLKDEILVDSKFTSAWKSQDTPLFDLCRAKLLRTIEFTDREQHFAELRNHIVKRLCVTPSLLHAHDENVKSWEATRTAADPFLSGVLWGGAGMLARSSYFRIPYCPHPQRRRLMVEADMLLDGTRAFDRLQDVIRTKRLNIAMGATSKDPLYALHATLPPIPVQVINECSSPSRFIETALALRNEYRPLRDWLRNAEAAIDRGDTQSIRKVVQTLSEVGTSGSGDFFDGDGSTSISIDLSYFGFTIPLNLSAARNVFGVRAMMNRMIFGESGHNALSRYCDLLGVSGSPIEYQLFEHFSKTE